jgi:hypothetical protein
MDAESLHVLNKYIDPEHQKIINQEISHWMGVLKCLMAVYQQWLEFSGVSAAACPL